MIRATALALALFSMSSGCKKKKESEPKASTAVEAQRIDAAVKARGEAFVVEPQTMVLRQVLVEVDDPEKAYALDSKTLAKFLGAKLLASGWLAAREAQVPKSHRARRVEAILKLRYDVTLASEESEASVVVAIEGRLGFIEDNGELHPRVALIMEKKLPEMAIAAGDDGVAAELELLSLAALDAVGDSLLARERLRRSSHEELLSHLSTGSDDVGLKIWGLQLAAERALTEALPAGIAALSHDDEDVQAAAIAMLVSLRDPRAVSALSKDIDFKDYEALRVVMEAVSAIGGEDATEFLEFVASGHPDEGIRARAKENLLDLQRGTAAAEKR